MCLLFIIFNQTIMDYCQKTVIGNNRDCHSFYERGFNNKANLVLKNDYRNKKENEKRNHKYNNSVFDRNINEIENEYDKKQDENVRTSYNNQLRSININNANTDSNCIENNCNSNIIIVLDLDETLIHAFYEKIIDYDYLIDISYNPSEYSLNKGINSKEKDSNKLAREIIYIKQRPFVIEFLYNCFINNFEILVFTASIKEYAHAVCDIIVKQVREYQLKFNNYNDSNKFSFKEIYHRKDCLLGSKGQYIKSLDKLNKNIERTVIIDVRLLYIFYI